MNHQYNPSLTYSNKTQVFTLRQTLECPASEVGASPALKDAVVPSYHRAPEPRRPELALVHRHGPGIGHDPHLVRNPRRQNATVHDPKDQNKPQHREAAEHGAPGPPHLDAAPARPTVHRRQDDNVDELEANGETGARDGGFQPGNLLGAGD